MTNDDVDAMVAAYETCALWSSTDDDGTPLDSAHGPNDLADEAREAMRADCQNFAAANSADLEGLDAGQVGHDFWLTRNHHGAGFWDRGLGQVGDRLTTAAHVYGGSDLYIGDDGRVYA